MLGKGFSELVYKQMAWDYGCRYKILGYKIQFNGKNLYVFDLTVPEVFREGRKKKRGTGDVSETDTLENIGPKQGSYPKEVAESFGVSVEQYREDTEVKTIDGYVSVALLTGSASQREKNEQQSMFNHE